MYCRKENREKIHFRESQLRDAWGNVNRELGLEVSEGKEIVKVSRYPYGGCALSCRCGEGDWCGSICGGCQIVQGHLPVSLV